MAATHESSVIVTLWRKQPGKYFCLCTKSVTGKWRTHWFTPERFGEVKDTVLDFKDGDVYFCPHGFDRKERKGDYAVRPKCMWADLDEATPNGMRPKPTIAIESSPGRFVGVWLVDKPITDDLNRQLTYAVGADRGGWDFTQVLRVPGTVNYKYKSHPKTRLLWADGPIWRLEDIVKYLPTHTRTDIDEAQGHDLLAQEVYAKYEKTLPRWVRKELLQANVKPGKRSDMIWKLEHALLECGMTKDESFVLIKASPWNKFRGRRDEDKQLQRELQKIIHERLDAQVKTDDMNGYQFLRKAISEVEEENVDWIWYPYLARGEVTIIEGDPGIGKSWLAQAISVAICDRKKLPCIRPIRVAHGIVAYFDIENRSSVVTKPRLSDMGLSSEGAKRFFQEEEPFSIDDTEKFQEVIDAIDKLKPTVIVFDTLNTYIGTADTHNSTEAQQAFNNFKLLASRFNCAVVALRHLTKNDKGVALYRGQGSIAFIGVARIVITVGHHPDDEELKVMSVTKLNLAKRPEALTFTLESLPDTLKRRDRARIVWGDFVKLKSDDILVHKKEEGGSPKTENAEEFLQDILDEGPVSKEKVVRAAERRGINSSTLFRAATKLNVVRTVDGFGSTRQSMWELP
jgi:archaellum biogenesis ATPase FlaH